MPKDFGVFLETTGSMEGSSKRLKLFQVGFDGFKEIKKSCKVLKV